MAKNNAVDNLMSRSKALNADAAADSKMLKLVRDAAENEDEGAPAALSDAEILEGAASGADVEIPPAEEPEKPAEPVEEPAKEEAPAEAAAETVVDDKKEEPAEPEKKAKTAPDENTRHRAARLQRQNDYLKKQNEALRKQVETAQPAAQPAPPVDAKPTAQPDPEPDRAQFPVEWQEWKQRDLERRSEALDRRIASVDERLNGIAQQTETQRVESQMSQIMDAVQSRYVAENPDFPAARAHLEVKLANRFRRQGTAEHLIAGRIKQEELVFFAQQAERARQISLRTGEFMDFGVFAMDQLMAEAEDSGWSPEMTTTTNDNGKAPVVKAPAEKLADQRARSNAGRSVTAMKPKAADVSDPNEAMSAQRWMEMSPSQRAQYKRSHPGFSQDRLMEGDEIGAMTMIGIR